MAPAEQTNLVLPLMLLYRLVSMGRFYNGKGQNSGNETFSLHCCVLLTPLPPNSVIWAVSSSSKRDWRTLCILTGAKNSQWMTQLCKMKKQYCRHFMWRQWNCRGDDTSPFISPSAYCNSADSVSFRLLLVLTIQVVEVIWTCVMRKHAHSCVSYWAR